MITVRQIDRLWSAKAYDRLLEQLISPRPEASDQLLSHLAGPLAAAGMAVIRLDELSQPFVPLYGELIRTILKSQRSVVPQSVAQQSAAQLPNAHGPKGGWGDVITTAICLRALMCGNGNGDAIDRGLEFLAGLQKPEGIWPNIPARRMPVDPFASAFVLARLGDMPAFRQAVDMSQAMAWFESNEIALDEQTRRLWTHAKRRVPVAREAITHCSVKAGHARVSARAKAGFWDFTAALSA